MNIGLYVVMPNCPLQSDLLGKPNQIHMVVGRLELNIHEIGYYAHLEGGDRYSMTCSFQAIWATGQVAEIGRAHV